MKYLKKYLKYLNIKIKHQITYDFKVSKYKMKKEVPLTYDQSFSIYLWRGHTQYQSTAILLYIVNLN